MATLTWQRVRAGIAGASRGDDDNLRHVAIRLAAQTVGLLLVMLLVLEILVYVVAGQSLLGVLRDTLRNRADQRDPNACAALNLHCPGQDSFGRFGGPGGSRLEVRGGRGHGYSGAVPRQCPQAK